MIEYLIVGVLSVGLTWLAYKHSMLEQQVADLQATQPQSEKPSSVGLEESVAQMIDELKAAADSACQEVTQTIDELRKAQIELETKASEARLGAGGRRVLPVETITQLADAGLSSTDIARQTGIGQAEIELTLRLHRSKRRLPTTLRRIKGVKPYSNKEIAVA